MRYFAMTLIVGLGVLATASESQAQFRPGFVYRNYYSSPMPYYYSPPMVNSFVYSSPYGYQSYYSSGVIPTWYGSTVYSTSGTNIRPFVMAPFHSVYWDPYANTYRYSGGYLNSPSYSYSLGYPYWQ